MLFAQPLVRVAQLRTTDIILTPDAAVITFAAEPVPVPQPFATLLVDHLNARLNQRGANTDSEWLFPSNGPGRHLHEGTIMQRLRALGINLLGARNRAIRDLVTEVPAPVIANLLDYGNRRLVHAPDFSTPRRMQSQSVSWSRLPDKV